MDGSICLFPSFKHPPGRGHNSHNHLTIRSIFGPVRAVNAVNNEFGVDVIRHTLMQHRQLSAPGMRAETGDHFGTLKVVLTGKLTDHPARPLSMHGDKKLSYPRVLKNSLSAKRGGPPSKPIEIKLTGGEAETLKAASLEIQDILRRYPGVSNIDDDLPFGAEQLVVRLTAGRQLDLTSQQLARQLRGAFEGRTLQTFYEDGIEIDVLLSLSESERDRLATLDKLPIITGSVANIAPCRRDI